MTVHLTELWFMLLQTEIHMKRGMYKDRRGVELLLPLSLETRGLSVCDRKYRTIDLSAGCELSHKKGHSDCTP
jgi:hypothetical protein